MKSISSLILLPICFFSSTVQATSVVNGSMSVHRDIYVPPDVSAMTADARKWYLTGVSNAKKDLTAFGPIVEGLKRGDNVNEAVKAQLRSVLTQVIDANENTKVLVPRLTYLIDSFVQWTRDPSWLDKIKLKTTMSYINGKRDNKSYYLQNGAGLWFKLRLKEYLESIPAGEQSELARTLVRDFANLQDKILLARDTLDDAAQVYVKGIAQLVPLVGDIGANEAKIRTIVDQMKTGMDAASGPILVTANDAVTLVQKEIKSLN